MSEAGGNKTEKPTPHSLREARKRGQVPKSRDIGLVIGMAFVMVLLWFLIRDFAARVADLTTLVIQSIGEDLSVVTLQLGREALVILMQTSLLIVLPIAAFQGVLEFLQTGPIFTAERMKPRMENINPVEGIKRMFSPESLFELFKSVVQLVLLLSIAWLVLAGLSHQIMTLVYGEPMAIVSALQAIALRIVGWTLLVFFMIMLVDASFQRSAFLRRMMMSRRDIQQETKDNEGDPHVKQARRQMAHEWSQEGATRAAREASVLVVNPTHVAVAIHYEPERSRVPLMTARGEEEVAAAMRRAAEQAGTPILRNETLARALLRAETEHDVVPRELFDIVAEVILWARQVKARVASERQPDLHSWSQPKDSTAERKAPGEDLTRYDADPSADMML